MPNRGDIVLVVFPFSDLQGEKRRPALVIGASKGHVVVLFITSKPTGDRTWRITLAPTNKSGLKTRSAIRSDKIASVDVRIVTGAVGKVSASTMRKVSASLKKLFEL